MSAIRGPRPVKESTAWGQVAKRIERMRSCGAHGLCDYLLFSPSSVCYKLGNERLVAHMQTNYN